MFPTTSVIRPPFVKQLDHVALFAVQHFLKKIPFGFMFCSSLPASLFGQLKRSDLRSTWASSLSDSISTDHETASLALCSFLFLTFSSGDLPIPFRLSPHLGWCTQHSVHWWLLKPGVKSFRTSDLCLVSLLSLSCGIAGA